MFLGFLIPERAEGAYLHPRAWRAFFIRLLTQQSEVRRQLKGLGREERSGLGGRPPRGRKKAVEAPALGFFEGSSPSSAADMPRLLSLLRAGRGPRQGQAPWPPELQGGRKVPSAPRALLPAQRASRSRAWAQGRGGRGVVFAQTQGLAWVPGRIRGQGILGGLGGPSALCGVPLHPGRMPPPAPAAHTASAGKPPESLSASSHAVATSPQGSFPVTRGLLTSCAVQVALASDL